MKQIFFKFATIFIFASMMISIFACKKKASAEQLGDPEAIGILLDKMTDDEKEFFVDKKIALLFGYNHNDSEFIEKTKKTLNHIYGSIDEDGNIKNFVFTITYPDDFSITGRIRNSRLLDLVNENLGEDEKLAGLLILGAPEGLHVAVAKLQDEFEKKEVKFPVFSFFSQDDVLGTEATSDIVLEFAPKAAILPSEGEDTGLAESEAVEEDIEHLITGTIKKFIELKSACPKQDGADLRKIVEEIDKNSHKVKNYSDSETGLLSKNHFVLGE